MCSISLKSSSYSLLAGPAPRLRGRLPPPLAPSTLCQSLFFAGMSSAALSSPIPLPLGEGLGEGLVLSGSGPAWGGGRRGALTRPLGETLRSVAPRSPSPGPSPRGRGGEGGEAPPPDPSPRGRGVCLTQFAVET